MRNYVYAQLVGVRSCLGPSQCGNREQGRTISVFTCSVSWCNGRHRSKDDRLELHDCSRSNT